MESFGVRFLVRQQIDQRTDLAIFQAEAGVQLDSAVLHRETKSRLSSSLRIEQRLDAAPFQDGGGAGIFHQLFQLDIEGAQVHEAEQAWLVAQLAASRKAATLDRAGSPVLPLSRRIISFTLSVVVR